MKRRRFIVGAATSLALLGGCVGGDTAGSETSSETTEPAGTKTSEISVESPTTQTETVTELPAGTSTSAQKTEATCGGARHISFYKIRGDMWNPSTVYVSFTLADGVRVHLVVLEGDRVLGTAQVEAPVSGVIEADGQPIHLNAELSGEYTINVVMYPNTTGERQFDVEEATPCRPGISVIQTGETTIDFSRFSENTSSPRITGTGEDTSTTSE